MNSENKHKKKNKMERGLTNRHVQVMAIAGTIGTGLFLGAGRSISLTGPSIVLVQHFPDSTHHKIHKATRNHID